MFKICSNSDGFTLAEVLITLAIIGVVAALTIPALMANYQKSQYITQLKAVYSQLSQGVKMMMADEGVNKVTDTNTLTVENDDYEAAKVRIGAFLRKYFKVVKDCGIEAPSPCFADNVKHLSGADLGPFSYSEYYRVIIASGASVCMTPGRTGLPAGATVDINGLKNPNTLGRDIFSFSYYYDGSVDRGASPECKRGLANPNGNICGGYGDVATLRENDYNNSCSAASGTSAQSYGNGCFTKILDDNWKMDY